MIVADKQVSLVLTGTGDVLEPEAGVMGIGSGGNLRARRRARALIDAARSTPRRSCARPWTSPPTSASTPTATSRSRSSDARRCTIGSPRSRSLRPLSSLRPSTPPMTDSPARRSSPSSTASSSARRDAKRAVAIALRNRWRRLQLDEKLREEVLPKNILMIGPTGVGKTEIARRLARLASAPFIKVEATKFTEVGYVGRDVEQIVRDLVEVAIVQTRETQSARTCRRARQLAGRGARGRRARRRERQRRRPRMYSARRLRAGELNDKEIEIEVQGGGGGMPLFEIPGMPGAQHGRDLDRRHLRQAWRRPHQDAARHRAESHDVLINEEV